MRSASLKIYAGETMPPDLRLFLDSNGIDYEWSAAELSWIVYYHFDDVFPYSEGLLNFVQHITGVVNNFPNRKGIHKDTVELYYEVEGNELNQEVDWFEWEGRYYQNVRFAELAQHQNKQLRRRQEIISI